MTDYLRPAPFPLSYWERETFFSHIDAVVIGSGIVGLTAAICLKERKPKDRVLVLERGPLPIGASTRNAGFACFGSLSELLDDAAQRPLDQVLGLVAERYRGLQRLRERLGDNAIDFRPYGGYELFKLEENDRFEACLEAMPEYNRALSSINGRQETYRLADQECARFGFQGVAHLIRDESEGQIHTGKMMAALLAKARAAGIEIYNGIGIRALEDDAREVTLLTEQGWELRAGAVLVATNGFAHRLLPGLELRPARNQVLITGPVPGLRLQGNFHYDRGYYYFRNIDGRILLGGARNLDIEGETTDHFGHTERIRQALLKLLQELILPDQQIQIDCWWSGIMGMGPVKQPIIRKWSERVAIAVRMGGMGVAIGSLVGEEGAELLLR